MAGPGPYGPISGKVDPVLDAIAFWLTTPVVIALILRAVWGVWHLIVDKPHASLLPWPG